MAQVSARYWLSTDRAIPKEAAEQLLATLAWRGISGWPSRGISPHVLPDRGNPISAAASPDDSYSTDDANLTIPVDWTDHESELSGSTLPITIYLSNEGIHQQVEAAIEALVAVAGLRIESRDDPVAGSWFRRMRVTVKEVARSPAAREATLVAAHVADTRLVLAQDAAMTATLLQNLGPVLAALQPTKDAVIRAGALLVVKVEWTVNVFQLTAAQQAMLDHRPQLARSPQEIVAALGLIPEDRQGEGPPALQ